MTVYCSYPSDAGHFAAMQDPKVFADDLFNFVNVVEKLRVDPKSGSKQDKTKKSTTKTKP